MGREREKKKKKSRREREGEHSLQLPSSARRMFAAD